MAVKAIPLCNPDCPFHEEHARKVNFMWGAGWVVGLVSVALFGGLFWMQGDTRAEMYVNRIASEDRCAEAKIKSDAEDLLTRQAFLLVTTGMANDINELVRVMGIISMNQKIVMGDAVLEYMAPEKVHRDWEDDE